MTRRMIVAVAALIALAASPLHAQGLRAGRAVAVRETVTVSVTIPDVTAFAIGTGHRTSSVALSLFHTSSVVIVRSTPASRKNTAYLLVSLAGERQQDGGGQLERSGGEGWSTIEDEVPSPVLRASGNGKPAASEVTYEIWSF